jgi:hypothetical protein
VIERNRIEAKQWRGTTPRTTSTDSSPASNAASLLPVCSSCCSPIWRRLVFFCFFMVSRLSPTIRSGSMDSRVGVQGEAASARQEAAGLSCFEEQRRRQQLQICPHAGYGGEGQSSFGYIFFKQMNKRGIDFLLFPAWCSVIRGDQIYRPQADDTNRVLRFPARRSGEKAIESPEAAA